MFNAIMSLYTTATARVWVNVHLLNAFSISNGTRQGYPLSPILFILTLEPFLQCLRSNDNVKDFLITDRTYKLADDLLLFLNEPHISIPNLQKEFKLFHSISNFKINFAKSHALNISLKNWLHNVKTVFLFQWKRDQIKYLGIYLTTNLSDMFSKNYQPILKPLRTT